MLNKQKNYIKFDTAEIIDDLECNEFKLEIKGKKTGDMIAYIYNDKATEGLKEVFWEDYNSKEVLKDILTLSLNSEWDCSVWVNDIRVR